MSFEIQYTDIQPLSKKSTSVKFTNQLIIKRSSGSQLILHVARHLTDSELQGLLGSCLSKNELLRLFKPSAPHVIYESFEKLIYIPHYGLYNITDWLEVYDIIKDFKSHDKREHLKLLMRHKPFREFSDIKSVELFTKYGSSVLVSEAIPSLQGLIDGTSSLSSSVIQDYIDSDSTIYHPHFGLIYLPDWSKLFPPEVLDYSIPIFTWANHDSKRESLIRILKSYKPFSNFLSTKERHDLTKHVIAKKSRGTIKQGKFIEVVDSLESLNIEPLFDESSWKGVFSSDGSLFRYPVRCKYCGTEYFITFQNRLPALCPKCKVSKFRSFDERTLQVYLESKGVEVLSNYRLETGFEIDLFIPKQRIGFELNGNYWHKSGGFISKDKNYHKMKTEVALSKGIKLYHLWETTTIGLKKSIILSKLGLSPYKVFARKCDLVEIASTEAIVFLNRNHVDGFVKSTKYFALKYKNKIICVLTLLLRNIQATHKSVWEIGRFATERGYSVPGGYSRLLKHAKEYLDSIGVHELISYCNRDLSPDKDSTFYAKQGFEFLMDSGPIYWYWNAKGPLIYRGKEYKQGDIIPRQSFQKKLLIEHYKLNSIQIPEDCTERSLAEGLGCYPIYNSGNFKYVLRW